jgi:hypothetical protein
MTTRAMGVGVRKPAGGAAEGAYRRLERISAGQAQPAALGDHGVAAHSADQLGADQGAEAQGVVRA